MAKLMQVECEPVCGFMIRSHDKAELMDIVKTHASNVHSMTVTEKDIKEKMKSV